MDCKDMALSNNYYDVITDYPVHLLEDNSLDICLYQIENYYLVYVNADELRNVNEYFFDYKSIPKIYGLMQEQSAASFDPNSLIVSGITQVQREPLSLTGRGVVICVIDTGERVILLSG